MRFRPYDVKSETEAEFVAHMVVESIKLLDSYNSEIKYKFLHGFISHLVLSALRLVPPQPCGRGELMEFTKKNLIAVKSNVQKVVGSGFTTALRLYSGMDVEYSCEVKAQNQTPWKGLLN